jgi:UrcA family protein
MTKLSSTFASAMFSAVASLAALAAALPAPALAAMPGPTVSVAVPTRDLDLTSQAGLSVLRHRLHVAATEACGEASSADPAGKRQVRQCRAELVRSGQQQALASVNGQERLAAR